MASAVSCNAIPRASHLFDYIVSDLELSGKDTSSPELMAVLDLVANDA